MSTTYVSELVQAQAAVDGHVAAGLDGCCLACGEVQPCTALHSANAAFIKYGRLPVRTPGLASRGIVNSGRFGWFAERPAAADGR